MNATTVDFVPSMAMALTDFIPVILFLIGSFYFGSFVKRHTCTFGFITFIIGIAVANFAGLCKAVWKLLLATETNAPMWMDDFQFLFLGIGFSLVFLTLLFTLIKERKDKKNASAAALVFTVKGTNLFYILLATVVVSTIGYLSCLITYAKKYKCKLCVTLYIVYGVISILMGALSGSGELESVNWIAQAANTIGTFCLLISHINLNRKDKEAMEQIEIKKAA